MNNWITILTFTLPHEAHLVQSKLDSEGIETNLLDELTVQVHNYYSNAIGGVKLQVRQEDISTTVHLLKEMGYLIGEDDEQAANKFLVKLDQFTAKIPILGKAIFEIRIIVFLVLAIMLIAVPLMLLF